MKYDTTALEGINTVLVTGAGSGIGKAFAVEFAKLGLNCVLVGRDKKRLARVASTLEKRYKVKTWIVQQDLSVYNGAQKLFNYCQKRNIQVDIVVNNAGRLINQELLTLSKKEITRYLYLHVHCTTFLTYLFGREMVKRRKGFIINISSISAWMTLPGIQLYGATKRYIRDFSRSMYYEFARSNVGVTVICPSGVNTGCFKLPKRLRKGALRFGLIIKPEQVAKVGIEKTLKFKKQVFPNRFDRLFIFMTANLIDPVVFWLMKRDSLFKGKKK